MTMPAQRFIFPIAVTLFAFLTVTESAWGASGITSRRSPSYHGSAKSAIRVSAGAGLTRITGNRGRLWDQNKPTLELGVAYKVNPSISLVGKFSYFNTSFYGNTGDRTAVTAMDWGVGVRWDPFSYTVSGGQPFVNPYIGVYLGQMIKNEYSAALDQETSASALATIVKAGMEFPVVKGSAYFYLEGQAKFAAFKDEFSQAFAPQGLSDLTGFIYTASSGFIFFL